MLVMTASDLIDTLGGNRKVAALFGVRSSAVSNWRAANRFPARLHYRISKECEAREIEVDERMFAGPADPVPPRAPVEGRAA